jgi:hypothetical protein
MKVMLQHRFDPPLKPVKKRVVACGTKLLDTIEIVHSSWTNYIVGNEHLDVTNQQYVIVKYSDKKKVVGPTLSKHKKYEMCVNVHKPEGSTLKFFEQHVIGTHEQNFISPKYKTCLSSGDFCMVKKVQNPQNFPITDDVIVSSNLSCPEQLEMKHACSIEFKELASSDDSKLDPSVVHKEPLHEDVDDAMKGLFLMSHEVQHDGTITNVKGQRCSIVQSECKIKEKVCKLIIDGGSFTNAISSDVVYALSLSIWRLPMSRCMQWMNTSGTLKITHKARVKFSVGTYVDILNCDVAPLSAYHLLLDRPWQFDLDATHGCCSNCYSFVHKGIHHVFKPMLESGIKSEVFAPVKKKYKTATIKQKPRIALLQGEENNVTILGTSDELPMKEAPQIISKPRTALLKVGEDNMTTISAPTIAVVNSINPIHIQFGTLDFGLKIEDENNMVPIAPYRKNRR